MSTFNVELPEVLAVNLKYDNGYEFTLADKSIDWVLHFLANGLRQSIGDADAGKAGTNEGKKAYEAKRDSIAKGEIPSGGGRGGPRLSYEDRAERDVLEDIFRATGEKAVVAKKSATADNAWDRVTRLAIFAQAKDQGMTPDEVKALDIKGLIASNLETVKQAYAEQIKEKAEMLKAADEKATVKIPTGIKLGEYDWGHPTRQYGQGRPPNRRQA